MKAILLIDMPEDCYDECPCCDKEYYVCNSTCNAVLPKTVDSDCPLIPLTEYEEARIKEILKARDNERASNDVRRRDGK